jgi:hypothetical protein
MNKLALALLKGPVKDAPATQHGSTLPEPSRDQPVGLPGETAPQWAVESIGVKTRQVVEPVSRESDMVIDQMSTFFHDLVPIPWMHGDQPVAVYG